MAFGFLLAIISAVCSATAAILQAIGVHRVPATEHLDPRLLWRLVRNGPYAAGLALDGAASGLLFTALRTAPLFAVQAVASANLGLVALIAMLVLRLRLTGRDWVGICGVVVGLLLLLLSAVAAPPNAMATGADWWLAGAVVALAVGAYLATPRMHGPALPGLLAGLSFGAAAFGARLLGRASTATTILASPASYALILAGLTGVLLYAFALQRGEVTVASAATILGQTVAPAAAGWLLLGDRVRSDLAPLAVLGFVLAVSGAVVLARHAHPNDARVDNPSDSR